MMHHTENCAWCMVSSAEMLAAVVVVVVINGGSQETEPGLETKSRLRVLCFSHSDCSFRAPCTHPNLE